MGLMTETPENPTVQIATATDPAPAPVAARNRTPRVFQAAAWVAIVAGIVFIVSAIFFTGYTLGRHSGNHGWHHGHKQHAMMHHHRMGGPGGPGGPNWRGGPGGPGGPAEPAVPGGPGVNAPVRPSAGVGQLPSSVLRGAAVQSPSVIVLGG